MARALWRGAISFGLVNVPVKLYKATPTASSRGVSFHQLHAVCGTRIQHVRHCPHCNVDVPWSDVVNGYEVSPGRYAVIKREEMPSEEEETPAIAIEDFVPAAEADERLPLLLDQTYWVVPDGPPKPYALLYRALKDAGRVAVARVLMRTRSHLAQVRLLGSHIVLCTLFFADEVVAESDIPAGIEGVKVSERELALARELVDRMTTKFEPGRYPDVMRGRLRELIEQKIAAREVAAPGPAPEAEVVDIMDALRRSVERAGAAKKPERKPERRPARRPARKHGSR